jgi:hypothetical protein
MTIEFPTWLDHDKQVEVFTDQRRRITAPVVLWGCLLALGQAAEPTAALAEADVEGDVTRWCLIWLTGHDLLYVNASKNRENWSAYDDDPDEGVIDQLEAWRRPLSAISAIELTHAHALHVKDRFSEDYWQWTATTKLCFGPDIAISFPPFGTIHNDKHDELVSTFLGEVHRTLAARS